MNIYYRRSLGYFFLIGGGFILVMQFLVFLLSGSLSLNIITGFGVVFIGSCQLVNPYFSFDNYSFTFYNTLGWRVQKYEFNSIEDLEIEKDRIYAQINGRKKKIPIVKRLIKNSDWEKLLEKIISEREKANYSRSNL